MAERKQRLVVSILEFLEASIADGTVSADDKDGVEVAVQCIGEAFGVDPSDEAARKRLSVKPATLPSIFDVYMNTKDKMQNTTQQAPKAAAPAAVSDQDKAAAEKHKLTGNSKMSAKDYASAIAAYTQAIALDPTNPVYYSNRAAAHSSANDHNSAVADAEKAIQVDPKFVKAYHRLGHAQYSLGSYDAAATAFNKGLELEPTNANLRNGRENALARAAEATEDALPDPPPAARGGGGNAGAGGGFDDVLRSLGGGAGGPGGLDIAGMMQNPAIRNMAQSMMANGGLENLMRNPALSDMMNRVQSGGGLPSMAELMNDPTMRQMAESLGGAAGGAGTGRGAGAPPRQ
ncbi:hypothetical protein M408DRAFT_325639 [Serendipita vermifera MAFF 305830]|uniref:SGTA homodimerisation domain-containing protein n=1 Tax=Serendipita vermifera MAFF 305830 TaxID=933852 RepID=A0A0C3BRY9_SERVB|nr:hypothetical protein M408DRAFT_325639 [Serendipita vermifera MAFF 305830]